MQLSKDDGLKSYFPILREMVLFTILLYFIKVSTSLGLIFYYNMTENEVFSYSLVFTANNASNYSTAKLVKTLMTSPVIETLVYFCFVYWLFIKVRIKPGFYIFISALVFSIAHLVNTYISMYLFILTFLGGLVFAYNYHRQYKKYSFDMALGSTVVIHVFANAMVMYV